jgi:hypothetical protein
MKKPAEHRLLMGPLARPPAAGADGVVAAQRYAAAVRVAGTGQSHHQLCRRAVVAKARRTRRCTCRGGIP